MSESVRRRSSTRMSMDEQLERLQDSGGRLSAVVRLVHCITGPRLRRQYFVGSDATGMPYIPNKLEQYAESVITAAHLLCSFAFYTSPLYFVYYLVRHGVPSMVGVLGTARSLAFIPISFSLAYVVRGIGRFKNRTYVDFLRAWNATRRLKTKIGPAEARLTGIHGYDFDMTSHPITFRYDESTVKPRRIMSTRRKGLLEKLSRFPISSLRYIAAHIVGRRLIYPGSVLLLNMAVAEPSSRGRATYKRKYDAHRARLLTADGNELDCMFVDRRGSPDVHARGNRLVICCEGNAAYYELGLLEVPAKAGYSVLGWNHPGFGDSTGLPFPSQEFNAVDVVVRYAVTELGFAFQDIIMYAWSIGGYTASCAAMSYPDIGAVILDASFDDLFPLTQRRIHPALVSFTHGMLREYYDLNIAEQMCRYSGPVLIVRRTEDEMMSSNGDIGTNRGNFLLVKILQHRYPSLVTDQSLLSLRNWLQANSEQERSLLTVTVNPRVCCSKLKSYMTEFGSSYPWTIGNGMPLAEKEELLLYLASQYMVNYESTHCVILPSDYFQVPPPGNIQ